MMPRNGLNSGTLLLLLVLISSLCIFSCTRAPRVSHLPPPRATTKLLMLCSKERHGEEVRPHFIQGQKYYPLWNVEGFFQEGKASWYGKKFHGRPTSSGERYNMFAKTAAHRTWPLGSYVKVVNLLNGRHTIVRINDRGPFVKRRIIDLSYGAAKEIGMLGPGVVPVKIAVLGKVVGRWPSSKANCPIVEVKDVGLGAFSVQVGAFSQRSVALSIANRLRPLFHYVEIVPTWHKEGGHLYRVRVSRSKTLEEASEVERRLKRMGFEEAFIVNL